MPNITFSVSEELFERMKKFPEIKWSTLYREIIGRYLEKLEMPNKISITELKEKLNKKDIFTEDISFNKAIETYKKMRELKWERAYSTRID